MARWSINWESTPDDVDRPKWVVILRAMVVLVVLVVVVSSIAALVVAWLVRKTAG